MSSTKGSIAIIGAGIGGLTAATLLSRLGFAVRIYEQAARFARVGAGIQQTPNAMRVHRKLGTEAEGAARSVRRLSSGSAGHRQCVP